MAKNMRSCPCRAAFIVLAICVLARFSTLPEIWQGWFIKDMSIQAAFANSSLLHIDISDVVLTTPPAEELASKSESALTHSGTSGLFPTTLLHKNPTSKSQTPLEYFSHVLPVDDFKMSGGFEFPVDALKHPFVRFGQSGILERLRNKVDAGQGLKIVVFGGSVTAGRVCDTNPNRQKTCAWPERLKVWLQQQLPKSVIEVHNFASGGSRTSSSLPAIAMRVRSHQPDIVIWDFGLNDCSVFLSKRMRLESTRNPMDPWPLGPEVVQKARQEDEHDADVATKMSNYAEDEAVAVEVFIRLVLGIVPEAQVIMLLEGPPRAVSPELGWSIFDCQTAISQVVAHYDISVVSYFNLLDLYAMDGWEWNRTHVLVTPPGALWSLPKFVKIPQVWKNAWQDHRHPTWPTHMYIAYVFAAFFKTAGIIGSRSSVSSPASKISKLGALASPLAPQESLAKFPVCTNPLSEFVADKAFRDGATPGIVLGGWRLDEDVVGKPGWIGNAADAQISFPVKFGAEPALALTFLSSYEGIGIVDVTLQEGRGKYTISGHWNDKTSQATTIFFRPAEKHRIGIKGTAFSTEVFTGDGLGGFGIKPSSEHTLQVTFLGSVKKHHKFKILAVFSC